MPRDGSILAMDAVVQGIPHHVHGRVEGGHVLPARPVRLALPGGGRIGGIRTFQGHGIQAVALHHAACDVQHVSVRWAACDVTGPDRLA